jgi:cytochrome P450
MATREITGYEAVRAAARDYQRFSSDLQGDRDVRDYRQLPLEADPPRHTLYRDALQPYFLSSAIEPHTPAFAEHARRLIGDITSRGGGEIVHDLALPYVMGCLSTIFQRPQDLDEWISWGPDVWTAEAYTNGEVTPESLRVLRERDFSAPSQRSGRVLEAYLTRVFTDAVQREELGLAPADIWDHVQRLRIDGHPLTRDEKFGIANVLLAGGRDTVIKLITGLTWHLVRTPVDRDYLTANPEARDRAIAELVRYLSPLPKIERIVREERADDARPDSAGYVLLNFASANHDRSVWPDADSIDVRRERKPHLGFGFGRHSCLGMNITAHESRAFLAALLDDWPGWVFAGEPQLNWVEERCGDHTIRFLDRFDSVDVTVAPSADEPAG